MKRSVILAAHQAYHGTVEESPMHKVICVKPRARYKLWLEFDDGISGEADLSDLVGKGVFKRFLDDSYFKLVEVGPYGDIRWPGEVDMCPDTLHMRVTRGKIEEAVASTQSPGIASDA